MKKQTTLLLVVLALLMPVPFTGCVGPFKPVPVAEGHDPIVVNAERAQKSSLRIYKLVTEWEYNNRSSLPADVSRAVDKVRLEFKPAWNESRVALKSYQQKVSTNSAGIERMTAALLTAQESILKLKSDFVSSNQINDVFSSLTTFINSVRILTAKPPIPPTIPTPITP